MVAQGLRIRLAIQGTLVQSLVGEDPTCLGATKSQHHSYWDCSLVHPDQLETLLF